MGEYKDWDDCIQKNKDKNNPEAYCGEIKKKTEDMLQLQHSRSKSKRGDSIQITNEQKKLVETLYGKGDFVEVEGNYYYKTDSTTYRVDFDTQQDLTTNKGELIAEESQKQQDFTQPPTNKKKEDNEMTKPKRNTHEDLTSQQVEEHYYKETKETEQDNSHAMLEARVAKLMEAQGVSREDALQKVKKRMTNEGKEFIDTEDMDKEEKIDDEEEEDEEEDKEEMDMKELETLRKENEELKEKNEKMKQDFSDTMDFVNKIREERKVEKEKQRQEKIDQLVNDFMGLTREEIRDDSMDDLLKTERRLKMSLKSKTEDMNDSDNPSKEAIDKHLDMITQKAKEYDDRYNLRI